MIQYSNGQIYVFNSGTQVLCVVYFDQGLDAAQITLVTIIDVRNILNQYPDLDRLITPIKGCSQLGINLLLTIYQGVHITYFNSFIGQPIQ